MNSISITGRVGNVRAYPPKTAEQSMLLVIGIADSIFTGKSEKETQWWNCKVYGKRAVAIQKYITKGTLITVIGQVRPDKYKDKQGNAQISHEVYVDQVDFNNVKRMDQAPRHDPDVSKAPTDDWIEPPSFDEPPF